MSELVRCGWAGSEPIYVEYHDKEWGVPQGDSRALFEKIVLEGFQAGLSWITILRKREHFRRVFDNFDAEKIAAYGPEKRAALMGDPGIIRHRQKVEAAVTNAQAYLALSEQQSLASFLWDFVDGKPVQNRFTNLGQIPPETPVSRAISKALKARGFRFVGPTTVYAMMQSVGMVNDHMMHCHRQEPCSKMMPKLK
ncbi:MULTISPECIES: DNA-3-methyladenine glycosylase I [Rhodomicrobium]|uniref:DNA-3-methyladenine glycosylase I n=1 Tax=Rhodomicrobium TaxID=1068 RepID=UPI001FD8DE58|nr:MULTISPECIES: DNA-3-methyladenine glycosylase I [Rhodomicrobium]